MTRTGAQLSALMAVAFAVQPAVGGKPDWTKKELDSYHVIAAGVQRAKKVVLYEGLPHQCSEIEQLKAELKSKKTKEFHKFPFYQELLPLKEEDAKRLTALFCDSESFKPVREIWWLGVTKLCGKYHPDYCIEWQDGKDVYQVLVCFGCCEVRCYGRKADLYCDIQKEAYREFEKILKPYRKNRPPRQQ
jgi:hypothetical protein